MKRQRRIILATIAIIATLIGVVYAVSTLTQTFPSVTIPGFTVTPAAITGCTALVGERSSSKIGGILLFDCGSGPAITANAGTDSSGNPLSTATYTPTFNLGSAVTSGSGVVNSIALIVYNSPQYVSCAPDLTTPLTTGTPLTITNNQYGYCVSYSGFDSSGGTINLGSITWSSGS